MDKYLKQKIPKQAPNSEKLLERQREFARQIKQLSHSPVPMVDDFRKDFVKDLPVDRIDTHQVQVISKGDDFINKIAHLKALRAAGKKVLGAVPVIGTLGAAAMSDDASAAMIGDSEVAGQSPEDEAQMLSEIQAQKDYQQSDAHKARLAALAKYVR